MKLLQIHEPGQTPLPHEADESIAVGIDLGTTNSSIAIVVDGKPQAISDTSGNNLYPSIVTYLRNGTNITGSNDTTHITDQENKIISSVKRLMGKSASDIKSNKNTYAKFIPYLAADNDKVAKLDIFGKKLSATEISAEILKHLKYTAEKSLGRSLSKAVITVPAHFDEAAKIATKDAAKLAGLEVLRLINEPTAAALAYGLDKQANGIFAIYDLGGGTFDISILKIEKGVFQVLATGGSLEIGGDDFDREIAEIFLWQCRNQDNSAIIPTTEEYQSLLKLAKAAKEYLTTNNTAKYTITLGQKNYEVSIDKPAFEKSVEPYINATVDIFSATLNDAKLNIAAIDEIILVGGSTRVPLISKNLADNFGKLPLQNIDPDLVVAHGAALQAHSLTQGSDNLLLDVLPLSLGIETAGNLVEKIIPRNTPIPISKAQEFTTMKDGQTGMIIHVVQGERETATQNRSLAKFELKNIPAMKAGMARIRVTFTVDADGLLIVTANETTTNTEQKIIVKPSYGLSEEEITAMLYSAMQHGKEDMELRLLNEAKIEAERLIIVIESAIKEDSNLLNAAELARINSSLSSLKEQIIGSDRHKISALTENLEHESTEFAINRMNTHIANSLRGKHIDND